MASFSFGSFSTYGAFPAGSFTRSATNDVNFDLIDDGANGTFEIGEDVEFNTGSGVIGTFQGTLTIGPEFFLVVQDALGNQILFSAKDAADVTYPSTYLASDVNPATYPLCVLEGTMITTPAGETRVEDLSVGDLVQTQEGRAVPIIWVGKMTIQKVFFGQRSQLVRITAGALGNHSDLYVTGDHGMVLDGCVINASALVNGHSIDWVSLADTPERQTVYHVETAAHDVIFTNGAPSETYLDMPGRAAFDNYQEYLSLYGAEAPISENPLPRITSSRLLPQRIQARLVA